MIVQDPRDLKGFRELFAIKEVFLPSENFSAIRSFSWNQILAILQKQKLYFHTTCKMRIQIPDLLNWRESSDYTPTRGGFWRRNFLRQALVILGNSRARAAPKNPHVFSRGIAGFWETSTSNPRTFPSAYNPR